MSANPAPDPFAEDRTRMLTEHLLDRGIGNPAVLRAFSDIPRHLFVPPELQAEAYADRPLRIGGGQTISQPYIAALMTEKLQLHPGHKVLEVGTGSGYQTAVLAKLGAQVYSIERIPELFEQASRLLETLGIKNVRFRVGDGAQGWTEEAPFDAILVAACARQIPEPLLKQLKDGGRMVIPVGDGPNQTLTLVERQGDTAATHSLCGCAFVPLL